MKKILSISNLNVKFKVRGKELHAIRNIDLDVFEGESLAIVGESGSGKSVLTKTFAHMLDSNAVISKGKVIFYDEELRIIKAPKHSKFLSWIVARVKKSKRSDEIELSYEIYLSVYRLSSVLKLKKLRMIFKRLKENPKCSRETLFEDILYVKIKDITNTHIIGECELDLVKLEYAKDLEQIRGAKIATIFQDPMTSLNPVLSIGSQITAVILKHQKCKKEEAMLRAKEMMRMVGILDAEKRYWDYPHQYSGGMRQRIGIAIALSCQPKILICDEPTTALDVTIQAQILNLIKDLQKVFHYTILFITHDLGVVANIADRVAVMYAGQIVEVGTAEDIFYHPAHPYTWALLSSMPQLATKSEELYSIAGAPPSLYQDIEGDAFAKRNPYALNIDFIKEAPNFKVSDTHYAKTWLLDSRAPKVEKPKGIEELHTKMKEVFKIKEDL